jgi:hypothetical protein
MSTRGPTRVFHAIHAHCVLLRLRDVGGRRHLIREGYDRRQAKV